ncbi:MAG: IS21 family transposase [Acidobacteria bacterium]|nr:IS21 family transposase [Acidobacteriota bacterium]
MLDEAMRTAILELHKKGHGSRRIATALGVARETVREVLRRGTAQVPPLERAEGAEPYREQILELYARYDGHLGRVHEDLVKSGAGFSYAALTAFCRRREIGHEPQEPAGRYDFAPGQEMQHDTSPHWAKIAGVLTKVQTASLVLCFSRMIFFQLYPRFTRFECKSFLTEAIAYFGGAAGDCMIDNTHVIVAAGTGVDMVPAPECAAFAMRYGFEFKAHEKGDANRSARVEAPFHRIETAFLPGLDFTDLAHLNRAARAKCDEWNAKYSNKLHASRRELFAAERPRLKPLPLHMPEVYQLHTRTVDAEGYVHVNRIRYSAPYRLIGRPLEVRETLSHVDLYDGPRKVATHARVAGPLDTRVTEPSHRPPRGEGRPKEGPSLEETTLLTLEPRLADYAARLKKHAGGRGTLALRRLLSMVRDYPREPLLAAVAQAGQYGLFHLDRLERMVLRQIVRDYFVLSEGDDE